MKADNASAASVAALKKQLEQLNAKLAKEEAERDAARAAVSKLQSELEQERAREAAATKDAASARAAADAARAAATKSAAEAKSRATTISAPVAAPAPAPAPAPVEKKAAAASEDNDSNPALGLLNALGIVVGGGLGGYVFVLNRNKEVGCTHAHTHTRDSSHMVDRCHVATDVRGIVGNRTVLCHCSSRQYNSHLLLHEKACVFVNAY